MPTNRTAALLLAVLPLALVAASCGFDNDITIMCKEARGYLVAFGGMPNTTQAANDWMDRCPRNTHTALDQLSAADRTQAESCISCVASQGTDHAVYVCDSTAVSACPACGTSGQTAFCAIWDHL